MLKRSWRRPQEHAADRGHKSMSLLNFVHLPIHIPEAMTIPEVKAALGQCMGQMAKTLPAWQESKVRNKQEVIVESQNEGTTVPSCCSCGLLSSRKFRIGQLDDKVQKYRGRVVLRGDAVKGDSGSCSELTEQGSSATHMTAAMRRSSKRRCVSMQDDFQMAGKKASLKPMWKELMSKVDLEDQIPIIDRKSETNNRIVTQKQKSFATLVSSYTITQFDSDSKHDVISCSYDMEGHCTRVCWTPLRVSEQNGGAIVQSSYSLWITNNSQRKSWKQLEDQPKFARKSC